MEKGSTDDAPAVHIECCTNCSTHSWCTRHDEQKYHNMFLAVKKAISMRHPELQITLNQVPGHLKPSKKDSSDNRFYDSVAKECIYFPSLGAFQVKFMDILIFSKHQSQAWPDPQQIATLILKVKQEKQKNGSVDKYKRFIHDGSNSHQFPEGATEEELLALLEKNPLSLFEFENISSGKNSKRRLFKNRQFRENFKHVENELSDNAITNINELHFGNPISNSPPLKPKANKETEEPLTLMFSSSLEKETERQRPDKKVEHTYLDERQTFYPGKSQHRQQPSANMSLTDCFSKYKSNSKNMRKGKAYENTQKLKRQINSLEFLNQYRKSDLRNMSIPMRIPQFIIESNYKDNNILMKLPQFIRKHPNRQSPAKEGCPKQTILRLQNIEEQGQAHGIQQREPQPSEKMRKTGFVIIKEWDRELERLEDRFEKFQRKVQIIKQKKAEFENDSLQKNYDSDIDGSPLKMPSLNHEKQLSKVEQLLNADLEKGQGLNIPFLYANQRDKKPKKIAQDYFGIGQEERNQKLKKIYGRKRAYQHKEYQQMQHFRRKQIGFDNPMDSDEENHELSEEHNNVEAIKKSMVQTSYHPPQKPAKFEKQFRRTDQAPLKQLNNSPNPLNVSTEKPSERLFSKSMKKATKKQENQPRQSHKQTNESTQSFTKPNKIERVSTDNSKSQVNKFVNQNRQIKPVRMSQNSNNHDDIHDIDQSEDEIMGQQVGTVKAPKMLVKYNKSPKKTEKQQIISEKPSQKGSSLASKIQSKQDSKQISKIQSHRESNQQSNSQTKQQSQTQTKQQSKQHSKQITPHRQSKHENHIHSKNKSEVAQHSNLESKQPSNQISKQQSNEHSQSQTKQQFYQPSRQQSNQQSSKNSKQLSQNHSKKQSSLHENQSANKKLQKSVPKKHEQPLHNDSGLTVKQNDKKTQRKHQTEPRSEEDIEQKQRGEEQEEEQEEQDQHEEEQEQEHSQDQQEQSHEPIDRKPNDVKTKQKAREKTSNHSQKKNKVEKPVEKHKDDQRSQRGKQQNTKANDKKQKLEKKVQKKVEQKYSSQQQPSKQQVNTENSQVQDQHSENSAKHHDSKSKPKTSQSTNKAQVDHKTSKNQRSTHQTPQKQQKVETPQKTVKTKQTNKEEKRNDSRQKVTKQQKTLKPKQETEKKPSSSRSQISRKEKSNKPGSSHSNVSRNDEKGLNKTQSSKFSELAKNKLTKQEEQHSVEHEEQDDHDQQHSQEQQSQERVNSENEQHEQQSQHAEEAQPQTHTLLSKKESPKKQPQAKQTKEQKVNQSVKQEKTKDQKVTKASQEQKSSSQTKREQSKQTDKKEPKEATKKEPLKQHTKNPSQSSHDNNRSVSTPKSQQSVNKKSEFKKDSTKKQNKMTKQKSEGEKHKSSDSNVTDLEHIEQTKRQYVNESRLDDQPNESHVDTKQPVSKRQPSGQRVQKKVVDKKTQNKSKQEKTLKQLPKQEVVKQESKKQTKNDKMNNKAVEHKEQHGEQSSQQEEKEQHNEESCGQMQPQKGSQQENQQKKSSLKEQPTKQSKQGTKQKSEKPSTVKKTTDKKDTKIEKIPKKDDGAAKKTQEQSTNNIQKPESEQQREQEAQSQDEPKEKQQVPTNKTVQPKKELKKEEQKKEQKQDKVAKENTKLKKKQTKQEKMKQKIPQPVKDGQQQAREALQPQVPDIDGPQEAEPDQQEQDIHKEAVEQQQSKVTKAQQQNQQPPNKATEKLVKKQKPQKVLKQKPKKVVPEQKIQQAEEQPEMAQPVEQQMEQPQKAVSKPQQVAQSQTQKSTANKKKQETPVVEPTVKSQDGDTKQLVKKKSKEHVPKEQSKDELKNQQEQQAESQVDGSHVGQHSEQDDEQNQEKHQHSEDHPQGHSEKHSQHDAKQEMEQPSNEEQQKVSVQKPKSTKVKQKQEQKAQKDSSNTVKDSNNSQKQAVQKSKSKEKVVKQEKIVKQSPKQDSHKEVQTQSDVEQRQQTEQNTLEQENEQQDEHQNESQHEEQVQQQRQPNIQQHINEPEIQKPAVKKNISQKTEHSAKNKQQSQDQKVISNQKQPSHKAQQELVQQDQQSEDVQEHQPAHNHKYPDEQEQIEDHRHAEQVQYSDTQRQNVKQDDQHAEKHNHVEKECHTQQQSSNVRNSKQKQHHQIDHKKQYEHPKLQHHNTDHQSAQQQQDESHQAQPLSEENSQKQLDQYDNLPQTSTINKKDNHNNVESPPLKSQVKKPEIRKKVNRRIPSAKDRQSQVKQNVPPTDEPIVRQPKRERSIKKQIIPKDNTLETIDIDKNKNAGSIVKNVKRDSSREKEAGVIRRNSSPRNTQTCDRAVQNDRAHHGKEEYFEKASTASLRPFSISQQSHVPVQIRHNKLKMGSPIVSQYNENEFEGQDDITDRAGILKNIYFHDKYELRVYPTVKEHRGAYRDHTFRNQHEKRLCQLSSQACLFMNPLGHTRIYGRRSHLTTVLKILCDKSQNLIRRLFEQSELSRNGMYGIWICCKSGWKSIIIDDYVPTDTRNRPIFLSSNDESIWAPLLEKALAKAVGGYQQLQELSICQIFKMLTGSNYLTFKVKEDPTMNQRGIKWIHQNQKKNYVIQAERHKIDDEVDGFPEVFYVNKVKNIDDQLMIHLKSTLQEGFWIKMTSFCQQFKQVNILKLRQNYKHSHYVLDVKPNTYSVVQISVSNTSSGAICVHHRETVPAYTKTILYREEQDNLLRLVGTAKQKNKEQINFDCQLLKGHYYLFIDCGQDPTKVNLAYFGQEEVRFRLSDHVESRTLKNDRNSYIPVDEKENVLRSSDVQFRQTFTKSNVSRQFSQQKSIREEKMDRVRKQFIDYLMNTEI